MPFPYYYYYYYYYYFFPSLVMMDACSKVSSSALQPNHNKPLWSVSLACTWGRLRAILPAGT